MTQGSLKLKEQAQKPKADTWFKKIYKALRWAVRKLCCFVIFIENALKNSHYY